MKKKIRDYILASIAVKEKILSDETLIEAVHTAVSMIIDCYKRGNKLLAAGNGGSAADAQHLAAELVARFLFDRPALPALSLTSNTSILTAVGNDYGFEDLFARQIEANAVKGDIFFGISTSGNSLNILKAAAACKEKGVVMIGLTGSKPCKMDELCGHMIKVPSDFTPHIQEAHLMIIHLLCALTEEQLFRR
ncbi:MAG: D-sedoheptulose 7-phosphate isomerase [Deferribacteraceae bacterium]|jgi:D-sedoheptulose 7-phosphate isomerase|nr:D-sedoheptulose 7-phosphate isomerase [Deferribacteraceae bacterium]